MNRQSHKFEEKDITLCLHFSIRDLERLDTVSHKGGWDRLPKQTKEGLLWQLGLDVYNYGFFEKLCQHRTKRDGVKVMDRMIYSQERTDSEWINKRVNGHRIASMESQLLAKGDVSLTKEIGRLGR